MWIDADDVDALLAFRILQHDVDGRVHERGGDGAEVSARGLAGLQALLLVPEASIQQ